MLHFNLRGDVLILTLSDEVRGKPDIALITDKPLGNSWPLPALTNYEILWVSILEKIRMKCRPYLKCFFAVWMSKLHFCARKINQRNLKEHRLSGFFSPRRLFRFLFLFSLLLSQIQSLQRSWELEMAPRESLQLYSTIAHERCPMKILPD